MSDPPKIDTLVAALASREGRTLACSILGTTDPRRVAGNLDALCAARLGSGVEEAFFCESSVGGAFGLRIRDGRRIMLKAHLPDRTPGFLEAVCRVQRHLFEQGFPCPEPITGPLPFGHGFVTVEAFVDDGEYADAHEPEIRREMARSLAWMIESAADVPGVRPLLQAWKPPPDRGLWPVPHNALFDFEATAEGASWIDAIAAEAKDMIDGFAGRVVVGHADWSVKHIRFKDGEVRVAYDWDSLRIDREAVIVGTAAATFPATWYLEVHTRAPSPDEMRSFVEEYEAACDAPISARKREATVAAAAYAMAYSARCEYAVDAEGKDFREALSSYGEEYLRVES